MNTISTSVDCPRSQHKVKNMYATASYYSSQQGTRDLHNRAFGAGPGVNSQLSTIKISREGSDKRFAKPTFSILASNAGAQRNYDIETNKGSRYIPKKLTKKNLQALKMKQHIAID